MLYAVLFETRNRRKVCSMSLLMPATCAEAATTRAINQLVAIGENGRDFKKPRTRPVTAEERHDAFNIESEV